MEKGNYEKVLTNLKYEKNKWLELDEISSIILNDGRGIYPNWQFLRFLFKDNGDILVKHGKSEPYGARLSGNFTISYDGYTITFPRVGIISPTEYYREFRTPRAADILRLTDKRTLGEYLITKTTYGINGVILTLANPIKHYNIGRFSFYDPELYSADVCMHSTAVEGVYMRFTENATKPDKKYGVFHEVIRYKDIKEINLKVGSNGLSTYKLD